MRSEGDDVGAMFGIGGGNDPIHPLDVIIEAYNYTTYEEINGSCCICVATLGMRIQRYKILPNSSTLHYILPLDNQLNQLSYSNLGDCGLVVVRYVTLGTD